MLASLIDRFKQYRKQAYLNAPDRYANTPIGFVGAGGHSISNLYPAIAYLGLPLRQVCTRRLGNAEQMAKRFPNCQGTNQLQELLENQELKGILVCASPSAHFGLAKKVLTAGKHLFIEKPPCGTLAELHDLINLANNKELKTLVAVQKRYATAYKKLKKEIQGKSGSYSLRYATGNYPEGEMMLDLFIHPLDLLIFLFGPPITFEFKRKQVGQGLVYYLITEHQSGFTGSCELSTSHAWGTPLEELEVNTSTAFYRTSAMRFLEKIEKPKTLAGLPLEKVLGNQAKRSYLYQNTGFVPLAEYNNLNEQGYLGAIKAFADTISDKDHDNISTLENLVPVYEWITSIEKQKQKARRLL